MDDAERVSRGGERECKVKRVRICPTEGVAYQIPLAMEKVSLFRQTVEKAIENLTGLFRENPERWDNERMTHYDFFRAFFDELDANRIRDSFMWEYPVGVPDYGSGGKTASVDIVIAEESGKWIDVEIELTGPGSNLENEPIRCVRKLKIPRCKDFMTNGFIAPLIKRQGNKRAKGYGMTYKQLCEKNSREIRKHIGNSPIEIVESGVVLD